MHSGIGRVTSDALAMSQDPPSEDAIASLIDKALLDSNPTQRSQAAALLYKMYGVKTMYKSEDNTHVVFQPSEDEIEQFRNWNNTKSRLETVRQRLREQAQAITNRSLFHLSSFFVLFSVMVLFEVRRANRNVQSVEVGGQNI